MENDEFYARLLRIHVVLGGVNAAIVRIHDRKRLLDEACRLAVEDGGYSAAVISMTDPATLQLKAEAWAGISDECVGQINRDADAVMFEEPWQAAAVPQDATGVVPNDMANDRRLQFWRPFCTSQNDRSAFVAPLCVAGHVIGAISLFAAESGDFDDEEKRLLGELATDISFALDRFEKEAQINYLSYFDTLTCLPNRASFQNQLGQFIAQCDTARHDQIAVVFTDIERFSNINDTLGYSAGDALLREVARRLRNAIPDAGCLARIQGGCFAFVIKGCWSKQAVITLLERELVFHMSSAIQLIGKTIHVSVRAGISLFPFDGMNAETLIRNAEAALKKAKASKIRYLFYAAEMNARAAETLSIETRLRRAIDKEEFVLHYQPKVEVGSGKMVGLEALIRWEDPETGLVSPGSFIPVMEETGLIVEVGRWVIERTYRQYCEWTSSGLDVPRIAVNVSQLQIRQDNFVDQLLRVLGSTDRKAIEIEITESLFMENAEQNISKLSALRAAGITVAIDDFGTGYSSLSCISRLPIDTLKIDSTFIKDMTTKADLRAIVLTIIRLSHSLDLNVVAEGVETQEQLRLLGRLGCDQVQGFVYSPALPPEQIERKICRISGQSDALAMQKATIRPAA